VATSLSYVEVIIGDSSVVTAQTRDAQGNALSALPDVSAANPAVASVNIDTVISGKPTPETQFSILANGFGTTTVTATSGSLNTDITVQTWPGSVGIGGATSGTTIASGAVVALTPAALSTGNTAFTTGIDNLYYVWSAVTPSVLSVDAGGTITAYDRGLGTINVEAFRLSDSVSTGATGQLSLVVEPQAFTGTPDVTQATGGQLVTVTQPAGAPAFDANTDVTIVPDDITIDPMAATITTSTATSLTFANPLSATTTTPVTVVISDMGAADVSQQFTMDVVGPFVFDGTVSSTSVTVGDVITVTAGATYPWDGDETFTVGGTDVDPLFVISQDLTSATFVVQIPEGGADGSAQLLTINNQTATQIQSGVEIDVAPYSIPSDPTAAPDITAGPFPFVFYAAVGGGVDDAFWTLDGLGYTVTVEWANSADIDILWYDGNGGRYYFNFDGASSANPEVSGYSAADYLADPPPNGAVLNTNMYDDDGNGKTLMKITVTQP
jgi:hypothetical protein